MILLLMVMMIDAAMAIGDPFAPKGHLPKLQPSTELHEPSTEPEPPRPPKEKSNTQNQQQMHLLLARELEEALGFDTLGVHYDRTLYVEVLPVQAEKLVSDNGVLSSHGQRRGGDVEVQHGSGAVTGV